MAYGNIIDASSNNVPTSFDETAGSLLTSGAPSSGEMIFLNYTSAVLAVFSGKVASAPSSSLPGKQAFIPAAPTGGAGVGVLSIKVTQGDRIYIRSASGSAATTAKIYWSLI